MSRHAHGCGDCIHDGCCEGLPHTQKPQGNAAAMRDALVVVNDALDTISAHEDDMKFVRAWIALTRKTIQSALSAPARNCDVGTAEEQAKRFREFCQDEKCGRYRCGWGCKATCIDSCAIDWAQTPYEAEEGGNNG